MGPACCRRAVRRRQSPLDPRVVIELRRDAVQRLRAQATERKRRNQGYSHAQAVEFLRRRALDVTFDAPNLKKVLSIVNRRSPAGTLRRALSLRELPPTDVTTTSMTIGRQAAGSAQWPRPQRIAESQCVSSSLAALSVLDNCRWSRRPWEGFLHHLETGRD